MFYFNTELQYSTHFHTAIAPVLLQRCINVYMHIKCTLICFNTHCFLRLNGSTQSEGELVPRQMQLSQASRPAPQLIN